jgi:hypothetical protein
MKVTLELNNVHKIDESISALNKVLSNVPLTLHDSILITDVKGILEAIRNQTETKQQFYNIGVFY